MPFPQRHPHPRKVSRKVKALIAGQNNGRGLALALPSPPIHENRNGHSSPSTVGDPLSERVRTPRPSIARQKPLCSVLVSHPFPARRSLLNLSSQAAKVSFRRKRMTRRHHRLERPDRCRKLQAIFTLRLVACTPLGPWARPMLISPSSEVKVRSNCSR